MKKNKDQSLVEVIYKEGSGFRATNGGDGESRFLSKTTRARSSNPFFVAGGNYAFSLLSDGFKLRLAGIDDKKLRIANKQGDICVGGVEPGTYEITEQTEDFVICKKQSK